MASDPPVDLPPGVKAERRKMHRDPVLAPLVGHIVEVGQSATLHDISHGGFSAMTTVRLTPGVVYRIQFVLSSRTVDVRALLVHAMRISGKQTSAHLLGFAFADAARDDAAIAELIREAAAAK